MKCLCRSLVSPLAALVAVCSLATGCGDGEANTWQAADAGVVSEACREAEQHSDLDWIQENILTPSCARFTACHMGSAPSAAGLNLEAGQSEAAMVGVASTLFPDRTLVVAGDPASSYLMVILGSYEGPLGMGGTMPYNNPLLCQQKREAIERWITSLGD